MDKLSTDMVKAAKAKGFLRNRGTDLFSGRVVSPGGVYTPEQLDHIAACARRYGSGKIAFTSRLSAEIVGIPYAQLDEARRFLEEDGSSLVFGGTGARIRPVTACKGTTCVFGCCDTQALARELHERYYRSDNPALPHKFKIAVGGCPNSCMKPSLNDFGIEARRQKDGVHFILYVGGMWGRRTRVGTPLSRPVAREEIIPTLDRVLRWYQSNASAGERLGAALDRVGVDRFEQELAAL